MSDTRFVCKVCGASFQHNRSLRRHVSKKHPTTSLEEIAPAQVKHFLCELCSKQFLKESRLQSHVESDHSRSEHSVSKLNFESYESFMLWKTQEEQTKLACFLKNKTRTGKHSVLTHYYICNRSGDYVATGKGERLLKTQGTCKIGKTCPSKIKARVLPDGSCSVEYNPIHVGHSMDIQHLRLSTAERTMIADNIVNQVPFSAILDNIRDTVSDNSLGRIHLLSKFHSYIFNHINL